MRGQVFGGRLPDEPDTQCEEYAGEGDFSRLPDVPDDVFGRSLAQAGQPGQLIGTQVVQVGDVAHQPVLEEQLDGLVAQSLDVHRLAAGVVDDPSQDLRPAVALIGAVVLALTLIAYKRRAAYGAVGDILERLAFGGACREVDSRDFRDDLAALLDVNHIAHADVQQGDLLGVVQGGPLDGRAGQQYRIEVGNRGNRSRASHLEVDTLQSGQGLLGLEFVCHGPFGGFGRESQNPLFGKVVDFDNYAVRCERKLFAGFVPIGNELVDLLQRTADTGVFGDFETPAAGFLQTLPMGLEGEVLPGQLVKRTVESPLGDDGRRLLFESSGGCIAWIGQKGFPVFSPLHVETVERGVGHEDFASYLEQVGIVVSLQTQGDRAYGSYVRRYIVSACSVSARGGLDQLSVSIGERDGCSVEFEFTDKFGGIDLLFDPVNELMQFVQRVGVAQREHRKTVLDAAKFGSDVAAHAGGR